MAAAEQAAEAMAVEEKRAESAAAVWGVEAAGLGVVAWLEGPIGIGLSGTLTFLGGNRAPCFCRTSRRSMLGCTTA